MNNKLPWNSFIRRIHLILGIDRAILYTSIARIIQAIGGLISIIFITKFLSSIEQGYYYTFASLLAVQTFFELGFNGIITQYVAYEVSHLTWINREQLIGDYKHLSRLSSIVRFSLKWYLIFAFLLLITLIFVGFEFFTKYDQSGTIISWQIPWILLSITTTLTFLFSPIMSIIEGLGKVKEIALIRLLQQIFGITSVVVSFYLGAKLYVPFIANLFIIVVFLIIFFISKYYLIIRKLWENIVIEKINYKVEILPYQWRIAVSWISGYFIFQLFNPVLFATEGPIVAGQMGMTLSILNGIQTLSLAWMTTKVPLFSGLIARKDYFNLDIIFRKTLRQSTSLNSIIVLLIFLIVLFIKYIKQSYFGLNLGSRILDPLYFILMSIPIIINQFVASWALYLRCHKKDPYVLYTIVGGVLCSLSTIFLGKAYGIAGVTGGYFIITLFLFPWAFYIFVKKKTNWHNLILK